MADFNCAYNQAIARRIILELEEEKLEFFEELLAPEDINGYAAIRNLTGSYIAAGENLFGKATYKLWLERGAGYLPARSLLQRWFYRIEKDCGDCAGI